MPTKRIPATSSAAELLFDHEIGEFGAVQFSVHDGATASFAFEGRVDPGAAWVDLRGPLNLSNLTADVILPFDDRFVAIREFRARVVSVSGGTASVVLRVK